MTEPVTTGSTPASNATPASVTQDTTPAAEPDRGFSINEDWAATIFGLVLLLLVLAGVITGTFMKTLIP